MDGSDAVIIALSGAIGLGFTNVTTWAIAKRQNSGNVGTTDAARLWAQNDRLIELLSDDNTALRGQLQAERKENGEMRERMRGLEMRQHQSELAESDCNERADALRREVHELKVRLNLDGTTPPITPPSKASL